MRQHASFIFVNSLPCFSDLPFSIFLTLHAFPICHPCSALRVVSTSCDRGHCAVLCIRCIEFPVRLGPRWHCRMTEYQDFHFILPFTSQDFLRVDLNLTFQLRRTVKTERLAHFSSRLSWLLIAVLLCRPRLFLFSPPLTCDFRHVAQIQQPLFGSCFAQHCSASSSDSSKTVFIHG